MNQSLEERQSIKWVFRGVLAPAVLAIVAWAACMQTVFAESEQRPNIVLIMADDMGYSDIGCYGGEINTPTLNRLAKNGLRFTQFYNTARCCPTRGSLLTGLYQHQAGIGHMMDDRGLVGYQGDLNRQCLTIAQALKPSGYKTYMAGKWHVTKHTAPDGNKSNWPRQRGFDRFYGTIHGAGSFYDPNSLTRDNTQISPYADPEYKPETYYYTDAISDQASRFIDEHCKQNENQPFFLYMAYTAAHWPMHALEKDIAKYRGKYDAGYTAIRKARLKRMREMGLVDTNWELSPQAEDWAKVKNREWEIRCMEVYAAMVDSMDQGIGRMVTTLKANGQLDNTLIFYLQDNGGCAEGLGRRPQGKFTARPIEAPFPPMKDDALQRDMIPKQTRDGFPLVKGPGIMPGPADTYIAYGRGWANVSNTPFREYKHWVHEGGISTPLIAHWPGGIAEKLRGRFVKDPGHLIDIMATCVDVARGTFPKTHNGQELHPLQGVSLQPAFGGKPLQRGKPIFFEHEGNRAMRDGRWKLVAKGPRGKWELYDVHADRSEMHNLAEQERERTEQMAAAWTKWATEAKVLPWPWKPKPNHKKKQ